MSRQKQYIFTPEMDKQIFKVYRTSTGNGEVTELAKRINIPRWRVSYRANEIGAHIPLTSSAPWTEAELKILEFNAHKHPETITKILKRSGFQRSVCAVFAKRKRLKLLQCLDGYSAQNLAECFGVDKCAVYRWINLGLLKCKKRGTKKEHDHYWITDKDIIKFIFTYPGYIDIRKVDKYWFLGMCRPKNLEYVR